MSPRVGLYLGVEPSSGGAFQHSDAILDAFAAMSCRGWAVVVAYGPDTWRPRIDARKLDAIHAPSDGWQHFFDALWRRAGLSLSLWRRTLAQHVAAVDCLERLHCALWVFPTPESIPLELTTPSLVTVFDLMHRYEPNFPEVAAWGRGRRRDAYYQAIAATAAGVLSDSEVGRRQFVESYGCEPERVHALPFVAARSVIEPEDDHDETLLRSLPEEFLLYPAQFWTHKNHIRLLRAVVKAHREAPDMALVLTGGPKNAYDAVVREIRALGLERRVFMPGYVSDATLHALYRRARGLIFPSLFGPTNIPPLEAFALGCPVACSNVYGMPEQVQDAALLFDPHSDAELSRALLTLWCDGPTRTRLIERGRARHAAWRQNDFTDRLEHIISAVIDGIPCS